MASLENRINELCKGSMLMSPIWLARLVEEIFDVSWMKRETGSGKVTSDANQWPLLSTISGTNLPSPSPWTNTLRSKSESAAVIRFLSPQGPLFTALRQSADAWVSVSFDSKLAQSDSVRIATGVQTIMRQPKISPDMSFQSTRGFDSLSNSDQNCMITLPVPHYFVLRLVAFLIIPDVAEALCKSECTHHSSLLPTPLSHLTHNFGVPSLIYADLIDSYCDYLFSNAKQPPGTTIFTSRSLCAELARLYIQAVSDFWLSPFASPVDASSLSFTSVSLPPSVLLHFIRRFLKGYFFHVADEWTASNSVTIRQTSFSSLKNPLLAFLHNCATHWPLNISFSNVVSCWRAVALPWHAQKRFSGSTSVPAVWESFVTENLVFYSETLLVPMLLHLVRANVACPAYAASVHRLAKVFGGAHDTDALTQLLLRNSSSAAAHTTNLNVSFSSAVSVSSISQPRAKQSQFCLSSHNVVSAVRQLFETLDAALTSPPSSCSSSTKEHLKSAKNLLHKVFLADSMCNDSIGLNGSPNQSFSLSGKDSRKTSPGVSRFRKVPVRQASVSDFTKGGDKFVAELDAHSTDIPIVLRFQQFFGAFLVKHGLTPTTGRAGALASAARFRWMADRRELGAMAAFLLLAYLMFSSPVLFFFAMFYIMLRTFFSAIVAHVQDLLSGKESDVQSNNLPQAGIPSNSNITN